MPKFNTFLNNLNTDRKITKDELIRAVRYNIAAEYEAIQIYMQLHDSTDDLLAKKVLKDISNEEKEHAGEFLTLLKYLSSDEEEFYNNGKEEVEEMMKKLGM
jgi:rubrerythrin